jgi:regulatory protein
MAAVRMLKGRSKSRARLEQGLLQKGYSERDVAAALQRVTELGYLDDRRHADAKARAGFAEGRSLEDVQRRLEAEGVAPATAAAAAKLAAEQAGYDAKAVARRLLAKRKLTGAKAARLLASRGFDEDVIGQLVGNETTEDP